MEPQAAGRGPAGYSVNKACLGRRDLQAGAALCSSSLCHGGGRKEMQVELRVRISGCHGVAMPLLQGEQSRWPKFWRPTLMTNWWSPSKPAMIAEASSTSMRRPLFEFTAAFPFLSVPSGFVPGSGEDGCKLSSCFSGECKGPDCVFLFIFRVLFVKARGCFVFSLSFRVPDVLCMCTADS